MGEHRGQRHLVLQSTAFRCHLPNPNTGLSSDSQVVVKIKPVNLRTTSIQIPGLLLIYCILSKVT